MKLPDREDIAIAICCGEHCDAVNHAPGHGISVNGYCQKYGCNSPENYESANAVLNLLKSIPPPASREGELREALMNARWALGECANIIRPHYPSFSDNVIGANLNEIRTALASTGEPPIVTPLIRSGEGAPASDPGLPGGSPVPTDEQKRDGHIQALQSRDDEIDRLRSLPSYADGVRDAAKAVDALAAEYEAADCGSVVIASGDIKRAILRLLPPEEPKS